MLFIEQSAFAEAKKRELHTESFRIDLPKNYNL